jgi:hypothetical protein
LTLDSGSGKEKFGSGIRYKHPGSATLLLYLLDRIKPEPQYGFAAPGAGAERNMFVSTTLEKSTPILPDPEPRHWISIVYMFFRYDLYSAYDYVLPARGKVLAKTDIQVSIFFLSP